MATAEDQIAIIGEIDQALRAARIAWWLFGGWGMDAHVGRVTRAHHDIEFWVAMGDAEAVRAALCGRAFAAVGAQPPEESQEYERDGVRFSAAYFVRAGDDFAHPEGRWSDWRFPPGSFGDAVGAIGGRNVPVMSVAGMLAMKSQYSTLRNGRPLRDKDVSDMTVLRDLASR